MASYTLWNLPVRPVDDSRFQEPQYGDRDYDYGLAPDGWPNPAPCIVCGTPLCACTSRGYRGPDVPYQGE